MVRRRLSFLPLSTPPTACVCERWFANFSTPVIVHPVTATAIVVLALVVIPAVFNTLTQCFLNRVGFRRQGVLRGMITFRL